MALLNQTDLQKMARQLKNLSSVIDTPNKTRVSDGDPTIRGDEITGDTYFDPTTHNLYVFNIDRWDIQGDFTWRKYAVVVNNLSDDGTVSSASDVIGFRDTLLGTVKWIGEKFNQFTPTESNDPTQYAWRLAPAGLIGTDLIDTTDIPNAPIGFTFDSANSLYRVSEGGGFSNKAELSWINTSTVGIAEASTNIVSYKLTSDSNYTVHGEFSGENTVIPTIASGTYDFKVVAVSALGVVSADTLLTGQQVVGQEADPANPSNLSLNVSGANAQLSWSKSIEVDVLSGGSVQIRYHQGQGAAVTWATSQTLIDAVPGFATAKTVPVLVGTYLVKFFDAGGRESVTAGAVINTFAPAEFNAVATKDQETTFSGNKTDCSVVNAKLKLDSAKTFMSYDYDTPLDLKSIKSVRVLPTFTALATNISDTVCSVTRICDRTQFCATEQQASIKTFISTTQSDPADSGALWSPYEVLIAGEYSSRGLRFRITAGVGDTNTTIEFEKIGATIDAPDIVQTGFGTTTAGGDLSIDYPVPFYSGTLGTTLPRIGVQTIGGERGDEVVVPTRTATGFSVSVYKSGVRVVRDLDWQAIGI